MANTFKAENGLLWNMNQLNKLRNNLGRTVTSATTLAIADADYLIKANSGSAIVLTIPNDTTVAWQGNAMVSAYQAGAGAVSFAAGSGVTLRSPSGIPAAAQYSVSGAMRVGPNEWTLV